MRATRVLFRIGAVVLTAGFLLPAARGQVVKNGNSGTNAPAVTAELRQEIVPGFTSVTRVYVSAGTNKFAFRAPRSFRVDASNPKKISLTSTNDITFITVRSLPSLPKKTDAEKKKSLREICRELLLAEHPGAKILTEFTREADGHSGPAFDLQWPNAAGALQSARVAYIPVPAGILEFQLSTKPDHFRAATYKLNNVLLSFRASKDGKVEMMPLSNKL